MAVTKSNERTKYELANAMILLYCGNKCLGNQKLFAQMGKFFLRFHCNPFAECLRIQTWNIAKILIS